MKRQSRLFVKMLTTMTMVVGAFALPYVTVAMEYADHYGRTEYCQWETFNATCRSDEMILMQNARYGRMRFGRCMREDHGSVGCSADVLDYMDRKCSGRRTCQVTIPDASLHANLQCPKEVMPYLDAVYTCITVKAWNQHACSLLGGQPLKTQTGYIQPLPPLSHSTDTRPPFTAGSGDTGSSSCPWIIQMHSGQRINLTLISFHLDEDTGKAERVQTGSVSGRRLIRCSTERVVVQDGNRSVELTLCGERRRERQLYLSEGNSIRLHVGVDNRIAPEGGGSQQLTPAVPPLPREKENFLIKYEVVGCPDITDFVNTWVIRRGDTAIVRCNFTGETFFLTCLDTRWKGELSRCTTGVPTKSSHRVEVRRSPPQNQGILVVISLGVALGVALGVFILFSLVVCHRRRRKNAPHSRYRAGDRLLADSLSHAESDDRKGVIYTPIWPQQGAHHSDPCGCPIHHPPHPPNCSCSARRKAGPPLLQASPPRKPDCPTTSGIPVGELFPASSNFPMTSAMTTSTFSTARARDDQSSFSTFRPMMTSEAESTMTSEGASSMMTSPAMMTSEESTATVSSWDGGQAPMDTATSVLDLIRHHSLSIDHVTSCPAVEAVAD